jgi:hypothetical protein
MRLGMRRDVTAGSRHEHLVLYDPAAIPPDTPVDPDLEEQDPKPLAASAMVRLAEQGLAVILRIAREDCQADLRLVVEENVASDLRERAVPALDGAVLRLPGGKLMVEGVEFLCRAGETRRHSEAEAIEVPAGDYQVQVLNLMPWKHRHRALEIEKKTTRCDRVVGRIVVAYTWLGIMLFPANVLVAPAAVLAAWLTSGWQFALVLAGALLLLDVLVLAGFWGLKFGSRWIPALKRRSEAELTFDAENPDVVVCLRRWMGESTTPAKAMTELAVG